MNTNSASCEKFRNKKIIDIQNPTIHTSNGISRYVVVVIMDAKSCFLPKKRNDRESIIL